MCGRKKVIMNDMLLPIFLLVESRLPPVNQDRQQKLGRSLAYSRRRLDAKGGLERIALVKLYPCVQFFLARPDVCRCPCRSDEDGIRMRATYGMPWG